MQLCDSKDDDFMNMVRDATNGRKTLKIVKNEFEDVFFGEFDTLNRKNGRGIEITSCGDILIYS